MNEYDVLIVGGRAAGASLALLLARQGRRVLLVDRDQFPSDTMSTHLMSALALALLKELGVLEDVEAAGFRRLYRHRTWIGDCLFEGPAGPFGSYSLSPRRSVLDMILIDAAVAAGADFHERTRAESLLFDGGRVAGASLRSPGGEAVPVRARLTVGADGKSSQVAQWVQAPKYDEVSAQRPAYYAYFHGLEPLPEPALEIFHGGDQVTFVFPMRPDEDCIAIELQPEDFESFRTDVRGNFLARLQGVPTLARRIGAASIEERVIGTRGVANFFRKPYGESWALTGDAAYLKDPVTGLGVGDAIKGSLLLAEALSDWFEGSDWEQRMAAFQVERDSTFRGNYEDTLDAVRQRDLGPEDLGWLRGAMTSPRAVRKLAHSLPALRTQVFEPQYQRMVEELGRLYSAEAAMAAGE